MAAPWHSPRTAELGTRRRFRVARGALVALVVLGIGGGPVASASPAAETARQPHRVHIEIDPLPFVRGGYGGQIGYRAAALPRLRFAVASFALDVPDLITQLDDDNDGFHIRVRPSGALYVLYFLSGVRAGWVAGGSIRWLRLEYTHDAVPDAEAHVGQLSLEAIAGYKWHPWAAGFYVQPWLGVSRAVAQSGEAIVGDRTYDEPPVQLFATVNLGWELEL
jgi:hypothetical protein